MNITLTLMRENEYWTAEAIFFFLYLVKMNIELKKQFHFFFKYIFNENEYRTEGNFFHIYLEWKRISDWRNIFLYTLSENEYRTEGTFFYISWVKKNIGLKEHFFYISSVKMNIGLSFFIYIFRENEYQTEWTISFF